MNYDAIHCERCRLTPNELWRYAPDALEHRASSLTRLAELLAKLDAAKAREVASEAVRWSFAATCRLDCDRHLHGDSW